MNEKTTNGLKNKKEDQLSNLSKDDIHYMLHELGISRTMTHEELFQLSQDRLKDVEVSTIVRQERDKGY